MTHEEMDALYDLYALGVLEFEAATQIDSHVVDQCEYCLGRIRESVNATAALAGLADAVSPPARVRQRLLAAIQPTKPVRRWSFAMPALAAACLVLLTFSLWSAGEIAAVRRSLDKVSGERNQLRSVVEILSRSQTRAVQFGQSDNVAHGRVFVNPNGGFVVVGSDLPKIASNKTFELWLVPATGNPVPAGLFQTNSVGGFVHTSDQAVASSIAAVAVSVEPEGGSKLPTTKPFLIVPLS